MDITQNKKITNYYEAHWNSVDKGKSNSFYHEFSSKKAMHNYYEKHKNDKNKFNWKLTYRNKYGEFLKNISIDDTDYDSTENYDKWDEDGLYSYNIFGNLTSSDFYEIEDVIKMIDMAIEGKLRW